MKFTLLLLVAIAATATAGNLRAPLLVDCRGDAPAKKCCSWKNGEDHALYVKPRKGFSCCKRAIGMWMPTDNKKLDDQYCGTSDNAAMNFLKRTLREMAGTSYQFSNTISGMQNKESNAESDFKKNYVKHEKHENAQEKKNDDQMKLLLDKEAEQKDVKEDYKRTFATLRKTLGDFAKKKAAFLLDWGKVFAESLKARAAFKQALAGTAKQEALLQTEIDAFKDCKNEKAGKQKEIEELAKNIAEENKNVQAMAKSVDDSKAKLEETKKHTEEEAKKLDGELAEANTGLKDAQEKEAKAQKSLNKLERSLKNAKEELQDSEDQLASSEKKLKTSEKNLKQAQEDAAFIEVGKKQRFIGAISAAAKGISRRISSWWNKDCDEDCMKLRKYRARDYLRKKNNQPETVSAIMNAKLDEFKARLEFMQNRLDRHKELHEHDLKLHQEIMGELEKKFKEIRAAMEEVGKEIAKVEAARKRVDKLVSRLSQALKGMIQAQGKKLESERNFITKTQKDTDSQLTKMKLLASRVEVISKGNAACKKGVEAMKKDAEAKKSEIDSLTKKSDELREEVTKIDETTQQVIDSGAAKKAKIESEISEIDKQSEATEAKVNELTEDKASLKKERDAVRDAADANTDKAEANNKKAKKNNRKADDLDDE